MLKVGILKKFFIISLLTTISFNALAEDRREQNLKLFSGVAKMRTETIVSDYPEAVFFTAQESYENIHQKIQDIERLKNEFSDSRKTRSVYYETNKLISSMYKRYKRAVEDSRNNFFEATGIDPTTEELAASIKRKHGVDYEIIQNFLMAAPLYIDSFHTTSTKFTHDYEKISKEMISQYNENGNLIHPKISSDEFIKFITALPGNDNCQIGKIEKSKKYGEEYLKIYLDNQTDYFEISAASLRLKTPTEAHDDTYELLFGEAQGYGSESSIQFDQYGNLKSIKIDKDGNGVGYLGFDWFLDAIGNPTNSDLEERSIAKNVEYYCRVSPVETANSRDDLAISGGERDAGKEFSSDIKRETSSSSPEVQIETTP